MLNESLYVNIYLNNFCLGTRATDDSAMVLFSKDYTTSAFFIKVAYQQSNAINMAIKQNISTDQGIIVPFPYISNFSFNDAAVNTAHQVSISLRIYNMIGNKLRRIYLIPSSLAATTANLQAGSSSYLSASNVQFFIDSNLITQYDNTKYENLLNCKLSNKYWNSTLQNNNFFLPVYFYNHDTENNNLNEGMPVNSDTIISFICNNVGTGAANVWTSYDVFAEGIKNLVINRNGVAVV